MPSNGRPNIPDGETKDRTDRFFYWSIGGIIAIGLCANLYFSYSEVAPSITTFLELVKSPKTHYCGASGRVVAPTPSGTQLNCSDYKGYRVVHGIRTAIYEIRVGRPATGEEASLRRIADLETNGMMRLFNLGHTGIEVPNVDP